MSSKNTMTRDAMLFLPAKVVEGLLVIGCSSLYSHIFVEGAVSAFNLTNTTIQLLYLIAQGAAAARPEPAQGAAASIVRYCLKYTMF